MFLSHSGIIEWLGMSSEDKLVPDCLTAEPSTYTNESPHIHNYYACSLHTYDVSNKFLVGGQGSQFQPIPKTFGNSEIIVENMDIDIAHELP